MGIGLIGSVLVKKHEHGLGKMYRIYRGRDISNHAVRLYADHSR